MKMIFRCYFVLFAICFGGGVLSARKKIKTKILTYNAGLTETDVPHYQVRREEFLRKLTNNEIPGHVVCLQEIWKADDVAAIVQATNTTFPYTFSAIHAADGTLAQPPSVPACEPSKINPMLQCIQTNCLNSQMPLLACVVMACRSEVSAVPQQCLDCLAAGMTYRASSNTTAAVIMGRVQVCLSTPWQTTYGLLILSKMPLDSEVVDYHPDTSLFIPRAYLHSKIGSCHFFCTHLTGELSDAAYLDVGPFRTVNKQNLYQIGTLLKAANRFLPRVVLAGDFNVGKAVHDDSVSSMLLNSYKLLTQNFETRYVNCTYCGTNQLANSPNYSFAIDHVFVPISDNPNTTFFTIESASIELDAKVPDQDYCMSDHFAYLMTVEVRYTG
ncbi:uncharacterized protein LOC106164279 [Lingula anatina]|uniref:Uncharacterized protein LOC106164279 n=1 Tax=Lingula anatina TaxID=7574 RepID=A0A2R2MS17_LINAN|nr:uncharacterized protein LOC106164279 [Lingula anatina]|eukprot:XP_023933056.1 uncharacterized protein LOC106164279 [Lingula anatina]